MKKIPFYEFFDIVDTRNKLEEIESRARKEDRISWKILIEEIKKNIITNKHIEDFIVRTEKNICFSNIYYLTLNKHIDVAHDRINKENNENFDKLKIQMMLDHLHDSKFYKIQKDNLYKEINLINLISIKVFSENNDKINRYFHDKINVFTKRITILKLIYENNKERTTYEDDLFINFQSIDNIKEIIEFINNKTKVYVHEKLPNHIKIKEINKNPVTMYMKEIENKNLMHYVHDIIQSKSNVIQLSLYIPGFSDEHQTFCFIILFKKLSCMPSIIIIVLKEFLWLIYKHDKISILLSFWLFEL